MTGPKTSSRDDRTHRYDDSRRKGLADRRRVGFPGGEFAGVTVRFPPFAKSLTRPQAKLRMSRVRNSMHSAKAAAQRAVALFWVIFSRVFSPALPVI